MAEKRKRPEKSRKRATRRDVLKHAAAMGALPFALAVPSIAKNVVTPARRLRPLQESEAAFDREVEEKLAQGTVRPLPPGLQHPPPPPRQGHWTPRSTSKQTQGTKATFSNRGGKEVSDDTDYVTYHDGEKPDDVWDI